ncbi:hypothetical protein McaMca56_002615 [Microsporum canis]
MDSAAAVSNSCGTVLLALVEHRGGVRHGTYSCGLGQFYLGPLSRKDAAVIDQPPPADPFS